MQYRITIHRKGDGYCEEIKHCIKSISTLSTKNVTVTANITNTTANTTNATMTTSNSTFQNGTTHNNTSDLEVSSGMTSEITPTSEPTKKSTEKRSTDIIDILIGKRRRRRSRRVSVYFDLLFLNKWLNSKTNNYGYHFLFYSVVHAVK